MNQENGTEQQVNGLVVLLKENNVSEEMSLQISPAFVELYDLANEWKKRANDYLSNPELSSEEKAKGARTARLALVKVRTGIDKKRKELNEEDQQRIADRNKIGKVLTDLVLPTEKLLQEEEDRAENEEKARKEAIKTERLSKMEPLGVDCTFFDLANMPEEAFSILLDNSKLAFEKRIEDEKKAEEERALIKRFNDRVQSIISFGFQADNDLEGEYLHPFGMNINIKDIHSEDNETWTKNMAAVVAEIERIKGVHAAQKKAEEDRLKAERDEANRKAQLLEQQQKEEEERHKITLARQEQLFTIGMKMAYSDCGNLTEEEFSTLYNTLNAKFQEEQNRLFIEKKKKEREEELEKWRKAEEEELKRKQALAPDKEKLKIWVDQLNLDSIEMSSGESEIVKANIMAAFKTFKNYSITQINGL